MVLVSVGSVEALKKALAGIDVDVPPRFESRTTDQTERYCVTHLLSSLPHARLVFPLRVEHRDRPDMVLDFGGHQIGIEITEAIPINAARASVIRQSGIGPEAALITRSTPDETRKTRTELVAEIEADAGGPPWEGDAPEREWAAAMAHVCERKTASSRKTGYMHYGENWLLI